MCVTEVQTSVIACSPTAITHSPCPNLQAGSPTRPKGETETEGPEERQKARRGAVPLWSSGWRWPRAEAENAPGAHPGLGKPGLRGSRFRWLWVGVGPSCAPGVNMMAHNFCDYVAFYGKGEVILQM